MNILEKGIKWAAKINYLYQHILSTFLFKAFYYLQNYNKNHIRQAKKIYKYTQH